MLDVDADNGWYDCLPDEIRADGEAAFAESEKGELIPHSEIQKSAIRNGLGSKLDYQGLANLCVNQNVAIWVLQSV